MKENLNILVKAGNFCKSVAGVITLSVMLVSGISAIAVKSYIKQQDKTNIEQSVRSLEQTVKSFYDTSRVFYDRFDVRLQRVERSINEMQDDLGENGVKIDNTQAVVTKYLLRDKTLTKEEFYQYMEDLKKNGIRITGGE